MTSTALFAVVLVTMGVASPAFADGATGLITNANSGKSYDNLIDAIKEAGDGNTINLGPGNYTTYGEEKGLAAGKSLTFVGSGTDSTTWGIGAKLANPDNFGTEYNGDYSFDGSKTITFENMKLLSSKNANPYYGFIRIDNTIVNNCVIDGFTCFWGYTSAEFNNTTFNAPSNDYAIWTYSSPTMTFNNCTFNASRAMIKVYTDFSAGKHDITVNVNKCTFNSLSSKWDIFGYYKQALSIDDSNMGNFKYILNITKSSAKAQRDETTCSQLFGFGGKAKQYNTGRTDVTIDGTKVWSNGQKLTHSYTDGERDDNFKDEKKYDWEKKPDGWYCTGHAKCGYCGYEIAETVKATSVDTATCTEKGTRTYTATFSHKCFKAQTKTEEIAALGHDWGEPEYSWTKQDDGWHCTAKRVCKRDASHVEEETVKATYEVTTPATTEKEGEGTYTATFKNEAFETQTKTEPISKLPVKPQDPAKPKDDKPSKTDKPNKPGKTNKQTLPGTGDSTASVIMAMLSMAVICFAGSAIASKMRK